jgi:hypothetical protein
MQSISNAAKTEWGTATWRKELSDDVFAHVRDLRCPFSEVKQVERPYLEGKDWTKYTGHLHMDHSIRPEFFRLEPSKTSRVVASEFIQDFTHLYDPRERDYVRFILGEPVAKTEWRYELGDPRDWISVIGPRRKMGLGFNDDKRDARAKAFLKECEIRFTDIELEEKR